MNNKCNYCGTPTDGYHSGSWECGACWNWRKLDGPAARHWVVVTRTFLSNVDMHDVLTFLPEAMGSKEKAYAMIEGAQDLLRHCEAQLAMSNRQRNDRQGPRPETTEEN